MRWSVRAPNRTGQKPQNFHRKAGRQEDLIRSAAFAVFLAACGGGHREPAAASAGSAAPPIPAAPSATAKNRPLEPPPPGLPPDWGFPKIQDAPLDNGLVVRVIERHQLPVVQLDLVVKSGSATDRDKPGLASVAGELLKAGGAGKWQSRALLEAAESLGSTLDISTDRDSTRVTMSVTRDHFADALDIVGAVTLKPRFDPVEFKKLKQRETDRVKSLARTSAAWAASMVLWNKLFELPAAVHPYSRFDALAKDLDQLRLEDCRAWHKREFSPKNAVFVIAGDVDAKEAKDQVARALGAWTGDAPEPPTFTAPMPPGTISVQLVDRPSSPQAEVNVATLGPERQSAEWPDLRVTTQIVGGGVASRLFLDVREKRSLAYRTRAGADPVAHGPVPLILSAGTQTAKAGLTVQALLEHFDALSKGPPTDEELDVATRFLSDVFLVGVDTVSTIATMSADLAVYGLPNEYYDSYRAAVRDVKAPAVLGFSSRYFKPQKALIVVSGDAARLGKPLSHFGAVRVIDAEHGFVTKTTIPQDATASIELPRIDGT
jgi:zinc protease